MTDQQIYKPLKAGETRLLVVKPGPPEDSSISVSLEQCLPQLAQPYDALSYVWGDQKKKTTISLDGKPFDLTLNLHWALRRTRHRHQTRLIWADALCINQLDLHERSQQVTMMGSIFSHARKVLVCVGDPPKRDEDKDVASLINGFALLWGRHPNIPALRQDDPLRDDPRWRSVANFMSLPWFRRVWVIQEVGLARDPRVLYGRCDFSYREMLKIMRWKGGQTWAHQFAIPSLLVHRAWHDWTQPAHPLTFIDLLNHGALLDCVDARDHIYAFLAHPLAKDEDGSLLVWPDYFMELENVHFAVSRELLRRYGLRLLSSVEHTEKTIEEELPSWVVRWNVSLVLNDISRYPGLYRATPHEWAPDLSKFAAKKLELLGVILDRVSKAYRIDVRATPEVSLRFVDVSDTSRNLSWSNILAEFPHRPDAQNAILKTLCARDDLKPTELRNPENKETFEHHVKDVGINRCLFATDKGGFGVGPLITRPGDVCSLIYGAEVAFVLRPNSDKSAYKLLGEAFVHGFMNGEIEGMLQRRLVVQETIKIV